MKVKDWYTTGSSLVSGIIQRLVCRGTSSIHFFFSGSSNIAATKMSSSEEEDKGVKENCKLWWGKQTLGAYVGSTISVCGTVAAIRYHTATNSWGIRRFYDLGVRDRRGNTIPYCYCPGTVHDNCLRIVSRAGWGARPSKEVEYMIIPVQYVVIQHTATPECTTASKCAARVAGLQAYFIDTLHNSDIGENFLIGGDGKVYEGVGWHKIGAHTKGYNTMALGITLIGNFSGHPNGSSGVCAITDKLPPKVQLEALKKLLECGVKMGELDPDFKLLAHRQLIATESPGMTLFLELQNWPEWAEHL
uniref:Uncharacterized protein n=1 Tax=Timema tahoe TaxID=61484 RepID=A0A7R9IFU9_9NEOP|nr:unnamed protein product [Timema tahoe]